jgi:hypothetical protein
MAPEVHRVVCESCAAAFVAEMDAARPAAGPLVCPSCREPQDVAGQLVRLRMHIRCLCGHDTELALELQEVPAAAGCARCGGDLLIGEYLQV